MSLAGRAYSPEWSQPPRSAHVRVLPRELAREDVEQHVDRREDPPVGEAVADVRALALREDDPFLSENSEVSRGQGLAGADGARELTDGARRVPELDEEEEPIRIGESLTELRMEPEDLLAGLFIRSSTSSPYAFIRIQSCPGLPMPVGTLLRPRTARYPGFASR